MLTCLGGAMPAPAPPPVLAYIIDQRLLTGQASDKVVQRILGDETDLPSSVLVLCAWQRNRCQDVQFEDRHDEAIKEARGIMANWSSSEVPYLDSLENRFDEIYRSFDQYINDRLRKNHAIGEEDRKLSIVYITDGDISHSHSNKEKLRDYFPTDGCISDLAHGAKLAMRQPPRDARVEVRVQSSSNAQPLPIEAQRVLDLMAGYDGQGHLVPYFGQSRLDCRTDSGVQVALSGLDRANQCLLQHPSVAKPEMLECHAAPGVGVPAAKAPPVVPPPGRSSPGGAGTQSTQSSPPAVPPGNIPSRGAATSGGVTTPGGAAFASGTSTPAPPAATPGPASGLPVGGPAPNGTAGGSIGGTAAGGATPGPTLAPPSMGPLASAGAPAIPPPANSRLPVGLGAPPPATTAPATQPQVAPPATPPAVGKTPPQPVAAAFTGALVITTEQSGGGAGLQITWRPAAGSASTPLQLEVMALKPDGTVGPILPMQPITESEVGLPAWYPTGRYRVAALLPQPTAEAGNDCPDRSIEGVLALNGARVDHPTLVTVTGTVQGCVGDPAALLRLYDFMVQ
jgi:hypothetical protein